MTTDYASLIDNLPDAFSFCQVITDDNGFPADCIFVAVNKAFAEMFALSKDVLGKRITEVIPAVKESSLDWIGTFGRVALGGGNIKFEYFFKTLDRWYEINAYKDKPGYFAMILRDITEKKKGGILLLESEEKFRKLFELSDDAHVLYDDNQFIDCNLACIRMLGLSSRNELISLQVKDISPRFQPDGRSSAEAAQAVFDLVMAHGNHMFEWVCRRKDGSLLYLDVLLNRIMLHGKPIIHGVWRDITERKGMEEALIESEARFRIMADGSPLMIWSHDQNGILQFINKAYTRFFGLTIEDVGGENWTILVHPDDEGKYIQEFSNATREQRSFHAEARVKNAEGEWRWIESFGAPHFTASGQFLGITGSTVDITERLKTEARIKQSEANLLALIENTGDIIVSRDPEGRAIVFNSAFARITEKLFGIEAKPGIRTMDYLPGAARLHWDKILSRVIAGESYREEFSWNYDDGTRFYDLSFNPIRVDGRIVGFTEYTRDITERKEIEAALRESELEKTLILNNTNEIIAFHDEELRLIWANRAYLQGVHGISGLPVTVDSLKGKKCYEAWGLAKQCNGCPVSLAIQTGQPQEAEMTPQNQEHWPATQGEWMVRAAPVRNSAGIIVGAIEIAHNITERKRAEEALHKAHEELEQKVKERTQDLAQLNDKYRFLIDNTPDLIFTYDREFRHTFVNQSVCRVNGLKEEEILGKTNRDLGYPEDVVRELEQIFYQALDGNNVEKEITAPMPDGIVRTFWFLAAPVSDESGYISGITGTGRDITVRKKVEEEILKTDKLESIGILAGGIAHDFNNYLAVMLSNINLAKLYGNNNDLPKILEKLANLEKATLRARELSNQLFTFARGGAPVKEKISPAQLITDDIRFALSGTPVSPHFYLAKDLSMVEVDVGQFSQVLNNLTINAVQAMPKGGILEVRAENVCLKNSIYPDGPYVKLTIKDEGTGIPDKYLKNIFDPFFTTKDKGRGLGLPTSHSIIKKHGGHISVESQMGVGTSFSIFLPAIAGAGNIQSVSEDVLQGTGKVLIMDDEADLLFIMGESLSALGYDVTLSREGGQALELYTRALEQKQPFDLVILDLTIPGGMGGKQTLEELLLKDPHVQAIVASGYSHDPIMADYQKYGFKGAIQKPFTIEKLSRLVWQTLRERRQSPLHRLSPLP